MLGTLIAVLLVTFLSLLLIISLHYRVYFMAWLAEHR